MKRMTRKQVTGWLLPIRSALKILFGIPIVFESGTDSETDIPMPEARCNIDTLRIDVDVHSFPIAHFRRPAGGYLPEPSNGHFFASCKIKNDD